jgi:hypothetical protein
MLTQEQVFEMVRKESAYAQGWAKGNRKVSLVEGVNAADVHALAPLNGQPYSIADFKTFAKKYWDEADLAQANFTPDGAAVRSRILKVIGLLVRALQVHGRPSDLERIAGVSSSEFPIIGGGLKKMNEVTTAEGCLIPSPETKRLRNESPNCDPLKK